MKLAYFPVILGIISAMVVSGCNTKPVYSNDNTITPNTAVQTLGIWLAKGGNWDADANYDGVEVTVQPKDSEDNIVKTDATVNAVLYKLVWDTNKMENVKGDVIKNWSVAIKENDFAWNGVTLRLDYPSEFIPKTSKDYGYLEVSLTTPDGKTFSAIDNYVFLAEY